jgi:DnaJ-class molecular chaperone
MFPRPTYYLLALGLPADFDRVAAADIKAAYAKLAMGGSHPDRGGHADEWALVTAAYNELKAILSKKRGRYESSTDERWLAAWTELQIAKAQAARAAKAKAEPLKFVFIERAGEAKDDRRRRYARESQAFRYATDPEFAAKRRAASKRSHAKAQS